MTTILLAHSYFLAHDAKQRAKMRPYAPLGTLYAAGLLRSAGHDVTVFDSMLSSGENEFSDLVADLRPDVVVMFEDSFNFLSKMCLARMRQAAFTMIDAARLSGAVVFAAGSDASDDPAAYLAAGVHVVARREAEHAIGELVDALARPGFWVAAHDIAGLSFVEDGDVVSTPDRRNERHPDVFGRPARDLVDLEAYRRTWVDQHGYFSLNMVSTRGCPFHCNWCAKPVWGQRYAMRSAIDVADEMFAVKSEIRPDHVWFADDIFGLRPSWLADFAARVDELGAHIPFTIQSRCDLMSPEAVAALARSGCHEVWLGAESGSQAILDAMDKGTTVAEITTARQRLAEAGVRAAFFIQFGYPGERWADIMATVEMVRQALPDDIGVSVSYPLPGTRFHAMVRDQLGAKTHWDESGDLAMMFRGTYTTPFYRHLHATLHDDLDLHRRRAGLAPTPIPRHDVVSLDEHERRVAEGWAALAELERSCRNDRPTLLVRSEAVTSAPDLSLSWN